MHRRIILWLTLAVALFGIDRLCKWFAVTQWSKEFVQLFPGVDAVLFLNPGIAFSIPVAGAIAVVMTAIIIAIVLVECFIAIRHRDWYASIVLSAVVLGALSNSIDRILYGGVVDYIRIAMLPVFNLADLLVLAGMLALLFRTRRSVKMY